MKQNGDILLDDVINLYRESRPFSVQVPSHHIDLNFKAVRVTFPSKNRHNSSHIGGFIFGRSKDPDVFGPQRRVGEKAATNADRKMVDGDVTVAGEISGEYERLRPLPKKFLAKAVDVEIKLKGDVFT